MEEKMAAAVARHSFEVAAVAGHVASSKRFLLPQNERAADGTNHSDQCRHTNHAREKCAHGIFLNAIGDALDNLVHNGAVIALRFVITKAHHPPMFANSVPMYFDDAVVDLFTAGL
jgi:hypothetical protein